jgi:hypothetical protein
MLRTDHSTGFPSMVKSNSRKASLYASRCSSSVSKMTPSQSNNKACSYAFRFTRLERTEKTALGPNAKALPSSSIKAVMILISKAMTLRNFQVKTLLRLCCFNFQSAYAFVVELIFLIFRCTMTFRKYVIEFLYKIPIQNTNYRTVKTS